MGNIISSLGDFVSAYAGWFVLVSVLSFVAGLVLMPVFVTRIPADYFSQARQRQRGARQPLAHLLFVGAKNVLGMILLGAGLLMLFMPGQGLITMLVGLMIMNYPGKHALERWLIQRPRVLPAVNWLRAKYGSPPLSVPERQMRWRSEQR